MSVLKAFIPATIFFVLSFLVGFANDEHGSEAATMYLWAATISAIVVIELQICGVLK